MTSPAPSEPLTGQELYHGAPLAPRAAVKLVAAAVGTLYAVQILLVQLGVLALAVSMISNLVVLAAMFAFARARRITAATLGFRRAPARFLVAAGLLGISMWYVTLLLVELLKPPGDVTELEALVRELPLPITLTALTLFPAFTEEIVFRGVLARSLAARYRPVLGIAISAATFGVFHIFPPQIVSTFVLGLVLGLLAVRSRSIVPSIIVHVLNNAVAVVLARQELPALNAWLSAHPAVTLSGALVLVGCGIALSAKGAS